MNSQITLKGSSKRKKIDTNANAPRNKNENKETKQPHRKNRKTQKESRSPRFYAWTFTINNPFTADFQALKDTFFKLSLKYLCYGKELGQKEFTPHLQGYFQSLTKRTLIALKPDFPRAHLEPARGSPSENIAYCSKQGDFTEFGTRPMQGRRNDFQQSLSMTNKQIRERWPLHADRLIRNRNLYNEDLHRGFNEEKQIVYITGPAGSGKTKLATEMAGPDYDMIAIQNGQLLGYTNEGRPVILDEFRDTQCSHEFFLKLTDKYTHRLGVKYGDALIWTNLFIITSVVPSIQLYSDFSYSQSREDFQAQLQRRIDKEIVLGPNKSHTDEPSKNTNSQGDFPT